MTPMLLSSGNPVIALTLRHDRIDHFWFVLMHELIHVERHIDSARSFFDDLDSNVSDQFESEADQLALETFIPRSMWKTSVAYRKRTPAAISQFAEQLEIHEAIVVGRLRTELNNYTLFTDMLGQGKVRRLFSST